jgi:phosphoglycolate phosphatase-like HAD superfamily hydrolase
MFNGKKLVLLLALATCMAGQVLPSAHSVRPCVVAWDIHGVLVQTSYLDAISHFFFHNLALTYNSLFGFQQGTDPNSPKGLPSWAILKDLMKGSTTQKIAIAKENGNWQLATLIVDMDLAAHSTATPGIETVLERLSKKGCTQIICSNISPEGYDALAEKFPEVFNYFKDTNKQISTMDLMDETTGKPMEKGNVTFFNKLLEKNKVPENATKTFVDDQQKNLAIAEQAGFAGVLFKAGMTADELMSAIEKAEQEQPKTQSKL